jgi:DNA-binding response OmpR family regulator
MHYYNKCFGLPDGGPNSRLVLALPATTMATSFMHSAEHQVLILSVGLDATLLVTRTQIMRGVGYFVEQTTSIAKAFRRFCDGDFDFIVVCHSLPMKARNEFIGRIKARKPSAKVIFVSTGQDPDAVDGVVHSMNGPQALLGSISALLHRESSSH